MRFIRIIRWLCIFLDCQDAITFIWIYNPNVSFQSRAGGREISMGDLSLHSR